MNQDREDNTQQLAPGDGVQKRPERACCQESARTQNQATRTKYQASRTQNQETPTQNQATWAQNQGPRTQKEAQTLLIDCNIRL